MANPKDILKKGMANDTTIKTLIANAFLTRNLLHLAHWSTKSYAAHNALSELYDQIIDDIDEIVEVYQGRYGLLSNLSIAGGIVPKDICCHVKEEAEWVEANRSAISNGCTAIENLVDNLIASYNKTVYKLENLS